MLTKDRWREQWHGLAGLPDPMWRPGAMRGAESTIDCGDMLLVPVCEANRREAAWYIFDWRSQNRDAYPNDPLHLSYDSVMMWLDIYYFAEPRLLWLIYPKGDLYMPAGHLGFRLGREPEPGCELDGVLANPEFPGKGYMHRAFRHIDDLLQPDWWVVFPRPENEHAKAWYTRQGFRHDPDSPNIYEGICERWVWVRNEQGEL